MKKSEEKRAFSSAGNQALACGIALLALAFTAAPALAEEYYICAEGESSLEIAEKAGVSHELLLAANSLEAAEALPAGQLLRIPSELLFCTTVQ
ncbi:MAG: LysM domain-containing protein, partial [Bacillota bacterium]|nr:LysM domain-containing protein [Bacillota bacterium]